MIFRMHRMTKIIHANYLGTKIEPPSLYVQFCFVLYLDIH